MLDRRLTPVPKEAYSLHRRLSGAFLLGTKPCATVNTRGTRPTIDELRQAGRLKFELIEFRPVDTDAFLVFQMLNYAVRRADGVHNMSFAKTNFSAWPIARLYTRLRNLVFETDGLVLGRPVPLSNGKWNIPTVNPCIQASFEFQTLKGCNPAKHPVLLARGSTSQCLIGPNVNVVTTFIVGPTDLNFARTSLRKNIGPITMRSEYEYMNVI